MIDFIGGMVTMGFVVAALFFLRFWSRTRDPLFIAFSIAFALFATEQALLGLAEISREDRTFVFLLRLAGFLLIILGIVWKNRGRREGPRA